jgi:hypothetical protein
MVNVKEGGSDEELEGPDEEKNDKIMQLDLSPVPFSEDFNFIRCSF